jgi:hypothetical protein
MRTEPCKPESDLLEGAHIISTAHKDEEYYRQLKSLNDCRPMMQECVERRTVMVVALTKLSVNDPYLDRKAIGIREAIKVIDWVMTVLPNLRPKQPFDKIEKDENGSD